MKRLLLGIFGAGLFLTGCASGTTGKDPVTGSETGMKTNTETEKVTGAATTPGGQANREDLFNSYRYKNPWKTGIEVTGADGKTITLREVTVNLGGDGDPIEIYQLTDLHFNAIYDDEDAMTKRSATEWGHAFPDNETILATYQRCMNYAAVHADRIVLTGDLVKLLFPRELRRVGAVHLPRRRNGEPRACGKGSDDERESRLHIPGREE